MFPSRAFLPILVCKATLTDRGLSGRGAIFEFFKSVNLQLRHIAGIHLRIPSRPWSGCGSDYTGGRVFAEELASEW